jgi:hypothetical protein
MIEGVENEIIDFIVVSFLGAASSLCFFYVCALIINYRNKKNRE